MGQIWIDIVCQVGIVGVMIVLLFGMAYDDTNRDKILLARRRKKQKQVDPDWTKAVKEVEQCIR